jgi:protein AbiQ
MKKQRLHLYHIDMKYVRDLARIDDRVMSVSPQAGKENR